MTTTSASPRARRHGIRDRSAPIPTLALVFSSLALVALALVGVEAQEAAAEQPAPRWPAPVSTSPAPPAVAVVVNVPAGRLDVVDGGRVVRSYPVTVGVPKHPTPIGEFGLSKAVWNPSWRPPDSFWARNKKPQPPGPENPMGRVKLYYKPLYYIHGTAETEDLGSPASHGCVRMANPDVIELARWLHERATPAVAGEQIDALVDDPSDTQTIPFEQPVLLRIVYEPVEVGDDALVVHPDVYRRLGRGAELTAKLTDQALAALAAAGQPVAGPALRERVAAQIAAVQREGGSIALAELLAVGGSAPSTSDAAGPEPMAGAAY